MPEKITLEISGMMCDGCVRRVRNLLERAGTEEVHSVAIGSAEITIKPEDGGAARAVAALQKAGYTVKTHA